MLFKYYTVLHKHQLIEKDARHNFGIKMGFSPVLCVSQDVFHIQELSSMFLQVQTSQGLRLQYNWREFRLYLQVSELWKEDTVGLCGTFNGNIQDDFL